MILDDTKTAATTAAAGMLLLCYTTRQSLLCPDKGRLLCEQLGMKQFLFWRRWSVDVQRMSERAGLPRAALSSGSSKFY